MSEQLDRIEKTVQEVHDWQLRSGEKMAGQVEELRKVVFGNGIPGLKADVAAIKLTCAARHPDGGTPLRQVVVGAGIEALKVCIIAVVVFLLMLWKNH